MTGKLQEMVSYELVSNFQLRSLSWWVSSHYRKDFFQMVNRVLFEKVKYKKTSVYNLFCNNSHKKLIFSFSFNLAYLSKCNLFFCKANSISGAVIS